MKTKFTTLVALLLIVLNPVSAQEKSKKQLKEEQKREKQEQVETMINLKAFTFIGKMALPSGRKSINLSTNPNFMHFTPDIIESEMPYFGTAYSPGGYGDDAGLKFKGKPEEFTIEKAKKNYQINVVVSGEGDKYKIYLTVSSEGSATLSVSSGKRSNISYTGDIVKSEMK